MRKLLAYFHLAIADAFADRATGFIWMLNDTVPALIILVFWLSAFQTQSSIGGYSSGQMIIYYLGVILVSNLVAVQPQYFLSNEIRSGAFSNYLVKPLNFVYFKIITGISWRLVRSLFFLPLLLVLLHFFSVQLTNLGIFISSLFLSFLINFFIKLILGLTTIWLSEAGWLFLIFEILISLFSGEVIPLDLFPNSLIVVNNYLPFKYLLYFPLSLILHRPISGREIVIGFSLQLFWLIFSYCLYRFVFRRGVKSYSAYGG